MLLKSCCGKGCAVKARRFFNMVEITLALAVVGIGITGIMAMFPPAIQASRDSIAENYSADAASLFLSSYENWLRQGANWPATVLAADVVADLPLEDGSSWSTEIFPGVYSFTGKPRIFGIKSGSDFTAEVRVWTTQINDFFWMNNTVNIPVSSALRLHIEISWPASRKFDFREKRYYSKDVFK